MCVFHFLCCWAAVVRGSSRCGQGGVGLGEGWGRASCCGWGKSGLTELPKWLSCHPHLRQMGCVRKSRELFEALCRDKCLLSSVAVSPLGSNKVQRSPCINTKQKTQSVGEKVQFLGLCPFLLSTICGVQNQYQGHFGLATPREKAEQCNQGLAACQHYWRKPI